MTVRKVQLEYCYESKSFAPSDDILTVQRYELILKVPNNLPTFFSCAYYDAAVHIAPSGTMGEARGTFGGPPAAYFPCI